MSLRGSRNANKMDVATAMIFTIFTGVNLNEIHMMLSIM